MGKPINPTSQKKPPPPTAPKPKSKKKEQQPLEVYCRLRPLKSPSDSVALKPLSNEVLQATAANDQVYKFKHIFQSGEPNGSQKEIFRIVAFPLVKDLLAGQNALLFTYGVTSSGKTFTITGKPDCPGILPRTLDVLFDSLTKHDLLSPKFTFKSDNQNGFDINAAPDALLRRQIEARPDSSTPYSTPIGNNNYRHLYATPSSIRADVKKLESLQQKWANRAREKTDFKITLNHDYNFAVFVSYVEIYNNYIYDLLDESNDANPPGRTPLRSNQQNMIRPSKGLREDLKKRVYVQGAVEVEVRNADEAFDAFLKGVSRRKIGSTQMNAESSRSHSVFTIRLVQAPLDREGVEVLPDKSYIHVSQLSIVDLAGCERTSRTQAKGDRLKEASNINNSLMTLRSCFDIMRENQKAPGQVKNQMVPYRDSKLTHLFKNYFEGDGSVKMVLCLNPSVDDFNETQQVLQFGEQAQDIITTKGRGIRPIPTHLPYDAMEDLCTPLWFGPPYPKRFLENPEDDKIIPEWIGVAEKRKVEAKKANEAYLRRMAAIRQSVSLLENERDHLRQENARLKVDLEVREGQIHEMEEKMRQHQRELELKQMSLTQRSTTLAQYQEQLAIKDTACIRLQRELDEFKTSMSEHLAKEKARLKNWCAQMMAEKQKELEKEKCLNQEKMHLVRKILIDGDMSTQFNLMSPPKVNTTAQPTTAAATRVKTLVGEPATTITATSGAPKSGPPVVNPKFTPNLNEGVGKWLEHQPPGTIEMGTILKPQIKNSKSVTNLKPSDFHNGKYTKYAITHHEAVENGNIETQVYKGKVIPSSTGGAQVIFDDVETLKQGSPAVATPPGIVSRKRQALEQQMAAVAQSAGTPSSTATPSSSNSQATKSK